METLKWIAIAVVAAPFVIRISFWGMCTAKRLLKSGVKLSLTDKIVAYVLLAIGYPSDWIYNWSVGWIRFGELREWTYSARIQYYVDHSTFAADTKKGEDVDYWFIYLNVADPGHITEKKA